MDIIDLKQIRALQQARAGRETPRISRGGRERNRERKREKERERERER
jgi:hypothetical protein